MRDSKYLKAFQELAKTGDTNYELTGDCMLVERIPAEERRTEGGIILPDATKEFRQVNSFAKDLPCWVYILAVGKGWYDDKSDDKEVIPVAVSPGDIILIGATSIKWFSDFGTKNYEFGSIGLCRESDIQLRFKGREGYETSMALLNESAPEARP